MFVLSASFAQKSPVFETNGIAVNGYDVVAFFTDSKPVKGTKDYAYEWNGVSWLFSTKQHLNQFSKNPEKYAPQFGGYCAYGMSEGHKAPTQVDTWTIIDGKLYFNYNSDVKELWKKDTAEKIKKAEENWPALKDKE